MKKLTFIEEIAVDMLRNGKDVPAQEYVISDTVIIEKIKCVNDIEQADRDGRTLLINAAFYGREPAVKYLLEKHANVNAQDREGYTALHAAVQNGSLSIITRLLNSGANVNARDIYGNTPILRTTFRTSKEIFGVLLQCGANPNEKNDYGISAVDLYRDYPKILDILQK